MSALDTLNEFTLDNIPELDTVVIGALELFTDSTLPQIKASFKRPLVVGSVNAAYTGKILFTQSDAIFADESSYLEVLENRPEIDGAIIISASGGKHSVEITRSITERKLPTILYTNNPNSLAGECLDKENVVVFPKNREPYSYNTSTYLGMILAVTKESPFEIKSFIQTHISSDLTPTLSSYPAFTFILPAQFTLIKPMLRTKFDELFGTKVFARFFTEEELKHAKTIVPDDGELFLNFTDTHKGYKNEIKLSLPSGYAGALATTYYLIGLIQKAKSPYFKDNIAKYCEEASLIFNQNINPIVE